MTIAIGGLLAWLVGLKAGRHGRGLLAATGLIIDEALTGIDITSSVVVSGRPNVLAVHLPSLPAGW